MANVKNMDVGQACEFEHNNGIFLLLMIELQQGQPKRQEEMELKLRSPHFLSTFSRRSFVKGREASNVRIVLERDYEVVHE
jgi:hypothetical protein